MKKLFISIVVLLSTITTLANETRSCYSFEVNRELAAASASKYLLSLTVNPGGSIVHLLRKSSENVTEINATLCTSKNNDYICEGNMIGNGSIGLTSLAGGAKQITANKLQFLVPIPDSEKKVLSNAESFQAVLTDMDCAEFKE